MTGERKMSARPEKSRSKPRLRLDCHARWEKAFVLTSGAGVTSSPLAEIFVAVFDLFRSSLVAGAGLLDASWRGVGLALGRLFDGSLLKLWFAGDDVIATQKLGIGYATADVDIYE